MGPSARRSKHLACIENLTTLCEPNTERVTSLMKSQLPPSLPLRTFVSRASFKEDDGGADTAKTATHQAHASDQNGL